MTLVGIIPNPASGKDIRRLVAHALVVGNREKSSIVRRMLIGLHTAGVDHVVIMPDKFGIGAQAIHDLQLRYPHVVAGVEILGMEFTGTGIDTVLATLRMREMGAGCLLTLGGDGTARLVAKECGGVPILAVSTGTNNVVPQFIEGSIAGLAAGIVAESGYKKAEMCFRSKRLDIFLNDQYVDMALVDVAAVASSFISTKAVWDANILRQVIVTRASPATIGLSAVIGMVRPLDATEPLGLSVCIGCRSGMIVRAMLGPGLVAEIPIERPIEIHPDHPFPIIDERPIMLALDGERELFINPGDKAEVRLSTHGPWLVDVEKTMHAAVEHGWFVLQK